MIPMFEITRFYYINIFIYIYIYIGDGLIIESKIHVCPERKLFPSSVKFDSYL